MLHWRRSCDGLRGIGLRLVCLRFFSTPPPASARPLLAIVGKPNGGKSTLFNRLVGNNRALVTPTPGTTRDRLYGPMQWPLLDKVVDVVDTGGMYHDEDFFCTEVTEQAQLAIDEAHMVLLVVDGRAPLDDKDRRVARILRRHLSTRPVLLVVNKVDNDRMLAELQERSHAAYRNLGLGDPLYVSALHAEGTTELQTTIFQQLFPNQLPADRKAEREKIKQLAKQPKQADLYVPRGQRPLRIAVVGNPNSGKSTLVNRMIDEAGPQSGRATARSLVSPLAGTTHDTVDTALVWRGGKHVVLLDTAGIERRAKTQRAGLQRSTVLWAMKTIAGADVNVLTIDAEKGVTANEKRIAGTILDSKSSVVVVVNKSDLLAAGRTVKEQYEKEVRRQLQFLAWVPVVFVCARDGTNVPKLVDTAVSIYEERLRRIPTRRLLELVERAQLRRPPPSKGHLRLKISFVTQAKTTTPTFVFFVNEPELVHFTYERFLENAIRESYPFTGSPINLLWKKKEGHEKYQRLAKGGDKKPIKRTRKRD